MRAARYQIRAIQPLAVPISTACQLLSAGESHIRGLLRDGELDSYRSGRSLRITIKSIEKYIERRLCHERQPALEEHG